MALTTTPSELTATALTLTTAAQPNITSVGTLTTLTVDDITINGSTISDAADFTIDVAGDITLDAGGGDINFKDDGTLWGAISNVSSDVVMQSSIQDKDIIFKGNDGGSIVTAFTLDMSDAGSATFNAGATFGGSVGIGSGSGTTASTGYDELVIQGGNADIGMAFLSPAANNKTQTISFGDSNNNSSGKITYNHSTDAMAFNTAGTERMRIDSGGNVGINSSATRVYTASFGSSDNVKHLTVKSASGSVLELVGSSNSHQVGMGAIQFVNDANDNNTANAGGKELALIMVQTETSDTNTSSDSGGALRIFTKPEAGTTAERMRIDSAGNVGINHTSPEHHLHVTEPGSTNEDGIVKIGGSNSGLGLELKYDQAGHTVTEIVANPTYTNTQSIMRLCVDRDANANTIVLTGAGNVGVGTDAPGSSRLYVYQDIDAVFTAYFCNDHAGAYGVGVRSDSDSMMYFYNGGTFRGRIYHNGSTMLYADQSDYRLKENVQPMAGSITRLKTLKPVTFDWKADKKSSEGFLAHEVQPVVPSAVSGEKDAKITEHGDGIQIMDYGKLTPVLVGALQEALAKIETLETKVAALEAK
jgi:hypothetical protein